MKYKLNGKQPVCAGDNFIAPNCAIIGDVVLEEGASVWFGATIRADNTEIRVGRHSNVQDGAVCHSDPGFPLLIGENVTVGHQAMLHGCRIEDDCLIGIQAVVLNGAVIGQGSIVGANALITEGMQVPAYSLVLGSPAKVVKSLDKATRELLIASADHYVDNAKQFLNNLELVE